MSEKPAQEGPELAALPDLPNESELQPLERKGGSAAGRGGGSQKGVRRELDRAPLELRKAAVVLMAGSILPWGDPANAGLLGAYVEKLLCYLAIWILYQSHVHKHGGTANSLVASLARSSAMVPVVVAGLVALAGLAPLATAGKAETMQLFTVLTEKAFLLLGGYTFVHIYEYEHGGRFNPMFPLMFLFPLLGGVMAIFLKVLPALMGPGLLSLVGALAVTAAGGIACHTMYVAMKEAKLHGEAKRAAAQQARKAAREERKRHDGGSRAS
jgi:hypothetical protein